MAWSALATQSGGAESQVGIELPSWKSEHAGRPYFPGGGLWPIESLQKNPSTVSKREIETAPEADAAKNDPAALKGEYVILGGKTILPFAGTTLPDDLPPLGPELYLKYFDSRPTRFLIDPQNLMAEQKANDAMRFLEFHSQESRFDIYAMVFGRNQIVPAAHNWPELHQKWFPDSNSILVVYHLEKPDSLQLFLSTGIASQLPDSVLAGIRSSCIAEAKFAEEGPDQMERIAIELSIQTIWLEKLIAHSRNSENSLLAAPAKRSSPSPGSASIPLVSPALVNSLIIGSAAILLLALAIFLKQILLNQRNSRKPPILFPGLPKHERLGGLHSGGAFVAISFDLENKNS